MRATKLLKEVKHLSYDERLKYRSLPTRGDINLFQVNMTLTLHVS